MTVMARYPLKLALLALAGATLLGALLLADRTPASGQTGTGLVSATVLPAGTGTVTGTGRYAIGTEVTLTATPGDGYMFHSWTSDSGECSGAVATCTLTISGTLGHGVTAHFRTAPPPPPPPPPTTYTLTTTANPAGSGDLQIRRQGEIINRIVTSSEHSDGTVVIVEPRANAARGWAFSAWGSGGDHSACTGQTCTVTMDQDRSITANFVRTHFYLGTSASPAAGGTVSGGGLFSATQSPAPTATVAIMTNTGYRFTGWSGACTGSSTCTVTMDAEKSVTANFVRTYELATGVSPSGSGTLDHGGGTTDEGTAISITATPNLGYRFGEWVSDAGGCPLQSRYSPVCAFTMSQAVTVTAHFVVGPTYMLTATASPAGGGTLTGGGEYNGGTGVDVTQTPNAGFRFSHWTGGSCSGAGTCSVTMTRDRRVVAIYVARYTLTTSATAGGSVSAGGTFDEGTDVTVTATPNTGYRFVGWSGHCTGAGVCIVTLAENSAVTANFVQRDDFLLLTGATPFAGGRVSEGGVYGFGIVATVTATANPGWRFDRWTGACTGSGACTVTMDDDKLVSAHFVSTAATVTLRAHAQPFRGGTVTGGGDYAPGTAVTLTATPEAGYTFEGWSGGCRAVPSTTCILTVNYPRIVIGRFAPPPPPPAFDGGGGVGFAPAPSSSTNVIVTSRVRGEAPAAPAFRFHFTCTEAGRFAMAPDETRLFAIEADDSCTLRVTDDEDAVRVSGRINAFPYTTAPICVFTRDGDNGDLFTDRSFTPGDYTAEVVFDYAARPEVVTIPLASGLTFIAWPGDGRSIDEAVGSFATAVHTWDAAGQRWLSWFPGGEALGINTLTAFRTGGVYVIARRAAFDGWRVEVSDSWEAPSVVRLVRGATFIEWRGEAASVERALGDRIAAVTAVYSWDVDEQRWLSWFPGGDDLGINTLTGFQPGGIYLISAAAAIDWRTIDDAAVAGAGDDEPPAC